VYNYAYRFFYLWMLNLILGDTLFSGVWQKSSLEFCLVVVSSKYNLYVLLLCIG